MSRDILYFNKLDRIGDVTNSDNIKHDIYSVPFTLSDESQDTLARYGHSGKMVLRERMVKAIDEAGYILYTVDWDSDFAVVTEK